MKLTPYQTEAQLAAIKELYMQAFPPEERKPFSLILAKAEEGSMEILVMEEEDGTFLGLAITILYKDRVLLDYLAVAPEKRGQNVGSRTLAALAIRHAGKRMIIEIEDPETEAPNTAERMRRRAFYLKNGLLLMPFYVMLFGVRMQILATAPVTFAEYHEIFPAVFSEKSAKNVWQIQ